MTATTTTTATLYIALELGQDKWLIAWASQAAQRPRRRSLPARDLTRLQEEIAKAKQRCGRPTLRSALATKRAATASGSIGP